MTGCLSVILNPKNLLFCLSLFTLVLTQDVDLSFKVFLGVWMTSLVFLGAIGLSIVKSAIAGK